MRITFILLLVSMLYIQCDVTKPQKVDTPRIYTSLADYLNTHSNVNVKGDGNFVTLEIRGMNSFQGDTRPFIYVDGIPFGRSYATVNSSIDPNNIKSVKVISSLSELSLYGEDGHSGVIKVETKSNN